ncbi:unnamed protein product, partial [Mesorhabditis spiculigera]
MFRRRYLFCLKPKLQLLKDLGLEDYSMLVCLEPMPETVEPTRVRDGWLVGNTAMGKNYAIRVGLIDILLEGDDSEADRTALLAAIDAYIFPIDVHASFRKLSIHASDGSKSQAPSGSGKRSRRRDKKKNKKAPIETAM